MLEFAALAHACRARLPAWRRGGPPRLSADQVLRYLGPGDPAPTELEQARRVWACASRPSEWMDRLDRGGVWKLGLLQTERMPKMLYWYRAGLSLEQIGERVSFFGGDYSARRAIRLAARGIASRLNDRRALPIR
ncbi:MAG: hypothetical protein U0821_27375 [Chloroflexota bacterium]